MQMCSYIHTHTQIVRERERERESVSDVTLNLREPREEKRNIKQCFIYSRAQSLNLRTWFNEFMLSLPSEL